jgi:hypothetical protein
MKLTVANGCPGISLWEKAAKRFVKNLYRTECGTELPMSTPERNILRHLG